GLWARHGIAPGLRWGFVALTLVTRAAWRDVPSHFVVRTPRPSLHAGGAARAGRPAGDGERARVEPLPRAVHARGADPRDRRVRRPGPAAGRRVVSAPVAIVTGGAGGLGTAIARVLVGDGFRVALLDRHGAVEAAAGFGDDRGGDDRVVGVPVDVTDELSM